MRRQPFLEQLFQLVGQPHDDISGFGGPGRRSRLQHFLQGLVVQPRYQSGDHYAARHACLGEVPENVHSPLRAGGARLQLARERAVEAGDGDKDLHQVLLRHRREQVQVALDQGGLGHHRERMLAFGEDLDDLPGDPEFSLDRLVAVGIRADGDRARHVARLRELGAQQLGRVGLREQLSLEVEPRRELEVRMARAGVAVDAAVLAAAIGIDRLREADVGRVVARDDRARALLGHAGLQLGGVPFLGRPAVVERLARERLEAAGNERAGAPQVGRLVFHLD